MTALVSVELRRFFARRLVKALAVVAIAAMAVTGILVAVNSRPGNEFHLPDLAPILEGTSFLFVIGGWLIGSSFVGAEWQAGTMTTLLTWEPRRLRVLVAKALACAVGVAVVVVVLQAVFGSILALVASTRGSTAGVDDEFLRSVVWLALRISAVSAIGALLGLAIAMVARNTGASIGIGFAYLAVVEGIMRGLRPGWAPWLIGDNANVLVLGRDATFPPIGRSAAEAALVLALYVLGFIAVAAVSFRARDVG
ncbi:MAG: ABC transporter permease [Actinomycetota bacterium]